MDVGRPWLAFLLHLAARRLIVLPGAFDTVCVVEADISGIQPVESVSPTGDKYYAIAFEIVLLFGLTELKAQIAYKEDVCSPLLLARDTLLTFAFPGNRKAVGPSTTQKHTIS